MSEDQNPIVADSAGQIDAGEAQETGSMATQPETTIDAPAGSYSIPAVQSDAIVIPPSIGRKVWFRPNGASWPAVTRHSDQPMDATVTYVWHDRMVNLVVFDHVGTMVQAQSVRLAQPGDPIYPGEAYCEWMPFQIGQAKASA